MKFRGFRNIFLGAVTHIDRAANIDCADLRLAGSFVFRNDRVRVSGQMQNCRLSVIGYVGVRRRPGYVHIDTCRFEINIHSLSRRAYLDLHQWNERPKISEDLNPQTTTVPANGHTHFALSKKFNEHLSLARPGRRIWKSFSTSGFITSQSVVQLPEHLPKNSRFGFLKI